MGNIIDASIESFNKFIVDQRELPGRANVSLFLFDDKFDEIHLNTPLHKFPLITHRTYTPRGMTAMNDAIGKVFTEYTFDADKTIVIILTDGMENCSQKFTTSQIKELIQGTKAEVIYLAANQDAFKVGAQYGFDPAMTVQFDSNPTDTTRVYGNMSSSVAGLRS